MCGTLTTHLGRADCFELAETIVSSDTFFAAHPQIGRAFLEAADVYALEDGELAGHVGETSRSIGGILDGALVTWLPIDDGSLRPVHVLRTGAWFASYGLLMGTPRRVALSAAGRCRLLHVREEVVDGLLGEHPLLWAWIARSAAENLDRTISVCGGLLADRPLQRIASRLLALSGDADGDGAHLAIELKQSDVALLSGMSRNTVSRTLGQLEAQGLIARGYRRLRVLDRAGLARVASGSEDA